MPLTLTQRTGANRAKKIAEGWKALYVLLPPDQAKKLEYLQTASGKPANKVLGELIESARLAQP